MAWRRDWERRRPHVLLARASGCGKTTAVKRLALDDVATGRSVVLIDPDGNVASETGALVPADRLVHIDPRLQRSEALDLLDTDPARARPTSSPLCARCGLRVGAGPPSTGLCH